MTDGGDYSSGPLVQETRMRRLIPPQPHRQNLPLSEVPLALFGGRGVVRWRTSRPARRIHGCRGPACLGGPPITTMAWEKVRDCVCHAPLGDPAGPRRTGRAPFAVPLRLRCRRIAGLCLPWALLVGPTVRWRKGNAVRGKVGRERGSALSFRKGVMLAGSCSSHTFGLLRMMGGRLFLYFPGNIKGRRPFVLVACLLCAARQAFNTALPAWERAIR